MRRLLPLYIAAPLWWIVPVAAQDLRGCTQAPSAAAAIEACSALIEGGQLVGDDLARAYLNRGRAIRFNDLDKAIADYNEAIRLSPNVARSYFDRAIAYSQKRDHDRVIADATEAVRLDPKLSGAFRYRGVAWRGKGELDKAIADLDEAVKLTPRDAFAHFERGWTWLSKGDFDRAIADHTEAIKLNPRHASAYRMRGNAWYGKREFDKAIADFDEAIRIQPNFANALLDRAIAWQSKGDLEKSLGDSNEAIRHEPKFALAYRQRGIVFRLQGETEKAIADFSEAIRLSPKNPSYYSNRALAYERKGDFDRAIADYDEAIRLDPRNLRAINARALLHERAGRLDKAIGDLRSALAMDPQQPTAAERIKRIEEKMAARSQPPRAEATPRGDTRVALVIGNSRYAHVPQLPNPKGDAEMIAATLKARRFANVTLLFDLTRDRLIEALRKFAHEAARADWAVVYFAGHGIEFGGNNFLIPVEATLASDRDVAFEAVSLDQVLLTVEGARKLRLVILDACRDNPFAKTMSRSTGTRSVGRGLAQVEPEGATLVAYAAKHGQFALDGSPGQNSPFVSALVRHLETPNVEISLLFRRVRDDVLKATGRRQEPFTYGSLSSEELFFHKN